MINTYVLYNPYANNGRGEKTARDLNVIYGEKYLNYIDITKIANYGAFFKGLVNNEKIIICGGDGTLNKFVNDIENIEITNDIYYYPTGCGNDFYKDVNHASDNLPIKINNYIKELPIVNVKNKKYRFINGIGYGIDGYCCEEGDKLKRISKKEVNYTKIAIKGLLFHYHPTKADIVVDGKEYKYKKVWLVPTMKGRYYGGGMMPTPNQDRHSNQLSLMVFHGCGKIKTLIIFASIFKGNHIKYNKNVEILTGRDITVKFNKLTPLQIDGETVPNVLEYQIKCSKKEEKL